MMQSPDSASFMYSIAKRARKYYLGLTTITQDVTDFLNNDMGKAIISNSSLQVLMKQSPSAVEKLQQVFNLSDGERNYLLNCDRGQGLFFAGSNHVGIQILSSQAEHELVTSDPKDLERKKSMQGMTDTRGLEEMSQIYEPPTQQSSSGDMENVQRQDQIIQDAIQKRMKDETIIKDERERYRKELEEKIKEEEKLLNPQKLKNQQSFLEELKQDTLSGQVIQSRQDIQKDKQHLTPQGLVESYQNNGQKQTV